MGQIYRHESNIGQNLGSSAEEREEGLYEPGGNQGHQKPPETASLADGNSQNLNKQLGGLHGTNTGPLHIFDSFLAWFVCLLDPWQWEQGFCWCFWLALGNPFFMLNCLAQPEYKGEVLVLRAA